VFLDISAELAFNRLIYDDFGRVGVGSQVLNEVILDVLIAGYFCM
jgi:hypothetical protein